MALQAGVSRGLSFVFAVLIATPCALPVVARGSSLASNGEVEQGNASEVTYPATAVPTSTDALLERMSMAAGVIFAGQVIAVRRPTGFAGSGQDAAEGVVEVDFRVDAAVLGPPAGGTYTVREWAGLWNGNAGRYRVGEQALVFLYAPDAHGLSSPVNGLDGIVPLRGGGVAPGPDDNMAGAAEWLVDLRWLQAQTLKKGILQTLPTRRPIPSGPIMPKPIHKVVPEMEGGRGLELVRPANVRLVPLPKSPPSLAPIETEPLTQVLALCRQAMRGSDALR